MKYARLSSRAGSLAAWLCLGMMSLGPVSVAPSGAIAAPSADLPQAIAQLGPSPDSRLPRPLVNRVRRALAERTGAAPGQFRIVDAQPQRWNDACLGLAQPEEICLQVLVDGWVITLSDGEQQWIYHTNREGQLLRLAEANTAPKLPGAIAEAVQQQFANWVMVPVDQIRVVEAQPREWQNSCLELQRPTERCAGRTVNGWRVTVAARGQTWSYRTDETGETVRIEPQTDAQNLPKNVTRAILSDLTQRQPTLTETDLKVVAVEPQSWDGCLGLAKEDEPCNAVLFAGWRVTLEGAQQQWTYHTTRDGSIVKLAGTTPQ